MLTLLAALVPALLPQVPCSDWDPGFELPGIEDHVTASVVFDDGTGPALYVAGDFDSIGSLAASEIARWDGTSWSALGSGVETLNSGSIRALEVHDDGSGPALYVGGALTMAGGQPLSGVARWDGTSWSAVGAGLGGGVRDLASVTTINGDRLFVGGTGFAVGAGLLGEWDGNAWTFYPGLTNPSLRGPFPTLKISALEVFQGSLYVAGDFHRADNQLAHSIAIWTGDGTWSVLDEVLTVDPSCNCKVEVLALQVYDDGTGEALYVSGKFDNAGSVAAPNFARWDGATWSGVGGGFVNGNSYGLGKDMAVYDDGSGPVLVIGGLRITVMGQTFKSILSWDGTGWSPFGTGLEDGAADVRTLTVFDDGSGPSLFAGGDFVRSGGQSMFNIGRWNGGWSPLGPSGQWLDDSVQALEAFDDGGGVSLYAAGSFLDSGGAFTEGIARWSGTSWENLGDGLYRVQGGGVVRALEVFDDGFGTALFAGGKFNAAGAVNVSNLARWNGSAWQGVGGGVSGGQGKVRALAVYADDSGPGLYVGGHFKRAGGAFGFANIARWDGALWSMLESGMDGPVNALAVFDEGLGGPVLFAGGEFTTAGGVPAAGIARWNGSSWSPVGGGLPGGVVNALTVFDEGFGPVLVVGGAFATAGGIPAANVARWNGTSWSAFGTGLNGEARALAADHAGAAPGLYAGGDFDGYLARWDGSSWATVAGGTTDPVRALLEFDDGASTSLFAGGDFSGAGQENSTHIARLSSTCGCPATSYCTAGTSASGCQALLSTTGTPSATLASGFNLIASGVEGSKDGLFFYGTNGRQANSWGSGTSFVCVIPPRVRGGLLAGNGSNGNCDGVFSQDLNARWCPTCPKPTHNPGAGAVMQAQLWYRDPQNTSNQTSSMSDAVEFVVCP